MATGRTIVNRIGINIYVYSVIRLELYALKDVYVTENMIHGVPVAFEERR